MVKGQHMRLEVVGSNPSQTIFLRDFGGLRYRLFYPVPKTRAFVTAFGVPVQEIGTKGHPQPVPMALFLVVLAAQLLI